MQYSLLTIILICLRFLWFLWKIILLKSSGKSTFSKWNPRASRGGYARRLKWTAHKNDQPVILYVSISANNFVVEIILMLVGKLKNDCQVTRTSDQLTIEFIFRLTFSINYFFSLIWGFPGKWPKTHKTDSAAHEIEGAENWYTTSLYCTIWNHPSN